MYHFFLVVLFASLSVSAFAANMTVTPEKSLTLTNSYDQLAIAGIVTAMAGSTLHVAQASQYVPGLRHYRGKASNGWILEDPYITFNTELGAYLGTYTNIPFAIDTLTNQAQFQHYAAVGQWYVPEDATYSFYANNYGGTQIFIDKEIVLQKVSENSTACVRDIPLKKGWHSMLVFHHNRYQSGATIQRRNLNDLSGIQFSPTNANITAGSNLGHPFEDPGDGSVLRSPEVGLLRQTLVVDGGTATLDLANLTDANFVGPFRLARTIASQNEGILKIRHAPGGTVDFGGTYAPAHCRWDMPYMIDAAAIQLEEGTQFRFCGTALITTKPTAAFTYAKNAELFPFVENFFEGMDCLKDNVLSVDDFHLTLPNDKIVPSNVTIRVSAGRRFRPFPAVIESIPNGTISHSTKDTTYHNDIILGGYGANIYNRPLRVPTLTGDISGEGDIRLFGWGATMCLFGKLTFTGKVDFGQRSAKLIIRDNQLGTTNTWVTLTDDGVGATNYWPCTVDFHCPGYDQIATTGRVGNVWAGGAGFTPQPCGAGQIIYAHQTISYGFLQGKSLVSWTSTKGAGDFYIGMLGKDFSTLYVATNLNVTVTNLMGGTTLHYYVNDLVNTQSLHIASVCNANASIRAQRPTTLPRKITGFTGTINLDESITEWEFPFDFSLQNPNLYGCDGSGTLGTVASTGVLRVTTRNNEKPTPGRYPLLALSGAAEKLNGWEKECPAMIRGFPLSIESDESGIWLRVKNQPGSVITLH